MSSYTSMPKKYLGKHWNILIKGTLCYLVEIDDPNNPGLHEKDGKGNDYLDQIDLFGAVLNKVAGGAIDGVNRVADGAIGEVMCLLGKCRTTTKRPFLHSTVTPQWFW